MNILFTCVGKRNYLINAFKEVLSGDGLIIACDASYAAPALYEADLGFIVPKIQESNYLDSLLAICKENKVNLLISLHDLDLPKIAENRDKFLQIGTFPLISSHEIINICFDKWKTYQYFANNGILTPLTFKSIRDAQLALEVGSITFPLVIKPRWGSASIGVEIVWDEIELNHAYAFIKSKISRSILKEISSTDNEHCLLVQQCIQGEELVLDVLNDMEGDTREVFVKRKLSNPAEGADRIITIRNEGVKQLGLKIGNVLRHIGNLDCDVMLTADGIYLLECNPRFGGGFPFTYISGVNIPLAIISWIKGIEPPVNWNNERVNVVFSKTERLIECNTENKILVL